MSYVELLLAFAPRPIKNEEQLAATQKVIDKLLDKGNLTDDEKDYLDVLGLLVYSYEEQNVILPDISGYEMLKFLMEQKGVTRKELMPIFKTTSMVSGALNGRRPLSARQIAELAELFNVSPAVFY